MTDLTDMSVRPYWELTFDGDGHVDAGQRDALSGQAARQGITDLVVFAHGWNNDRAMATSLYSAFFAPFPGLLDGRPQVNAGYVGVIWPSMRFTDEAAPHFPPSAAETPPLGTPVLDTAALAAVFPGREPVIARLDALLAERPESADAFHEFAGLVRTLVDVPERGADGPCAQDTSDTAPGAVPAMLTEDPVAVCEQFTAALRGTGAAQAEDFLGVGALKRLWDGARELLRQATYYEMKHRAGTVGQLGLGPVLGVLAQSAGSVRVHLVGHSFGARLVSFALLGLPGTAHNVKSTTLLQGAFSHYAFAERLPFDARHAGALRDAQQRVDGPVVSCFSSHDTALGVIYPIASRMAGDSSSLLDIDDDGRWGAMGHDGIQSVDGTRQMALADALRGALPATGCVSVDAAAVVRSGGPPAGAHSDICHPELARVVLAAGRLTR